MTVPAAVKENALVIPTYGLLSLLDTDEVVELI